MPSPRMPASPREAPRTVHSRSSPLRVAIAGVQAAGPAVELEVAPGGGLKRQAGEAADALRDLGLQAQRDVLALGVGLARQRPVARDELGRLPAQARRQPADEQQRGRPRIGVVADGDGADVAQVRAQMRRVEGRRHALAPRRRAQPRQPYTASAPGQGHPWSSRMSSPPTCFQRNSPTRARYETPEARPPSRSASSRSRL